MLVAIAASIGCAPENQVVEHRADRQMDISKLPKTLQPFLPLFEKWGDINSDSHRYALASRANEDAAEMRELKDWHDKLFATDLSSCDEWMAGPINPLDENYERAKVYFTFLLFDELQLGDG